MYGGTFREAHRPDDDEFYCVRIYDSEPVGLVDQGVKGSFDDMTAEARRILNRDPACRQVHVNHKGNFWHRVER